HNDCLGAPFGQDLHDFPMADNLHFLLMKGIALAFPDAAVTFNVYLLLTFPLTTIAALFVLRRLGVSRPPAIVASLLYTFLAYHLLRGMGQLFLAGYYLVPFTVLVLLWVFREEEGLFRAVRPGRPKGLGFIPKAPLSYCAICLLVSSAGVYYAFFF